MYKVIEFMFGGGSSAHYEYYILNTEADGGETMSDLNDKWKRRKRSFDGRWVIMPNGKPYTFAHKPDADAFAAALNFGATQLENKP